MKIFIYLTAILFLISCSIPDEYGEILIKLNLTSDGNRTVLPEVSMEPVDFIISGKGPEGKNFTVDSSNYVIKVNDILCGPWELKVDSFNRSGDLILSGSKSVNVYKSQESEININLYPVNGNGSLNVVVMWPELSMANPEVSILLEGKDSIIQREPNVSTEGASCYIDPVDSGYYILSIELFDNNKKQCGATETVRIINGFTTEAVFDFTDDHTIFKTDLEISVNVDTLPPPEISIEGKDILFRDTTAEYEVNGNGDLENTDWYMNGIKIGTGIKIEIDTKNLMVINRLDAVVDGVSGLSQGSASLWFSVLDGQWVGGIAFYRDYTNGEASIIGMSGARSVGFLGNDVFVAGYNSDSVVHFCYDNEFCKLNYMGYVKDPNLYGPCDLEIYSGGVVVLGYKSDSIGILDFDGTYKIIYSNEEEPWLDGPREAAIFDNHLYVANENGNSISVFRLNSSSIEPIQRIDSNQLPDGCMEGPSSLHLSPDGSIAAVTCFSSDSLLIFNVNSNSGELTFSTFFKDEIDGVDGLNGAADVIINQKSTAIYVTGYYDNSISYYVLTGSAVAFHSNYKNGDIGIEGMFRPKGMDFSSDKAKLYIAGSGSDSIAIFSVKQNDELEYVGNINREMGIENLDSPREVLVMKDHSSILIPSAGSNALNHFLTEN